MLITVLSVGHLLTVKSARNLLEPAASWGPVPAKSGPFEATSCWALRRGRAHLSAPNDVGQNCGHVEPTSGSAHLCIPMTAQGESLGVLCLAEAVLPVEPENKLRLQRTQAFASSLAEQISLAIANLRLRETLKNQSLRDFLTGLFNRRYMEETLDRELQRAARGGKQVPLIMVDLDNFKQFNDSYGHAAGDLLLREFGALFASQVRRSDIACRYGGEEFVAILADTPLEVARHRAETLREQAGSLRIELHGEMLRSVTVSIGVACFPENGTTSSEILNAADKALYAAKAKGRNRVVVASTQEKPGQLTNR